MGGSSLASSLMAALAASMERSREVSRLARILQKAPAARTQADLASIIAEMSKSALVAGANPVLQQDIAAMARLVQLPEAQALRLPQDVKGGAAMVHVLKGQVEVRTHLQDPFTDPEDYARRHTLAAAQYSRSAGGVTVKRMHEDASENGGSSGGSGGGGVSEGGASSQGSRGGGKSRKGTGEKVQWGAGTEGGEGEEEEEEDGSEGNSYEDEDEEEEEMIAGIPVWELQELFGSIDIDGSGEIDSDELQTALRKMGMKKSSSEVEELLMLADPDGSGSLGFDEFCLIVRIQLEEASQGSRLAAWTELPEGTVNPWRLKVKGRQCVGQPALLNHMPMEGILVALEDTALLVLDAAEYYSAQTEGFTSILNARVERLLQAPLLAACARPNVEWRPVAAVMHPKTLPRQAVVYEAAHAPDALYIIVEGNCKLLGGGGDRQHTTSHEGASSSSCGMTTMSSTSGSTVSCSTPRSWGNTASLDGGAAAVLPGTPRKHGGGSMFAAAAAASSSGAGAGDVLGGSKAPHGTNREPPHGSSSGAARAGRAPIEVALLGPGDICGEALLLGLPTYGYTLVTTSPTVELLQLRAADLPVLLSAVKLQKLQQRLSLRDEQRASRMQHAVAATAAMHSKSRRASMALPGVLASSSLSPEAAAALQQAAQMLQQQLGSGVGATPNVIDAVEPDGEEAGGWVQLEASPLTKKTPRTPRFVNVGNPRPEDSAAGCPRQSAAGECGEGLQRTASRPLPLGVNWGDAAADGLPGTPRGGGCFTPRGGAFAPTAARERGITAAGSLPQHSDVGVVQPGGNVVPLARTSSCLSGQVAIAAAAAAAARLSCAGAAPHTPRAGGGNRLAWLLNVDALEASSSSNMQQVNSPRPAAAPVATHLVVHGHNSAETDTLLAADNHMQQAAAAVAASTAWLPSVPGAPPAAVAAAAAAGQGPGPAEAAAQAPTGGDTWYRWTTTRSPSPGHSTYRSVGSDQDVGLASAAAGSAAASAAAVAAAGDRLSPSAAGQAAEEVQLPVLRFQTGGPYLYSQWDMDSWCTTAAAADLASWSGSKLAKRPPPAAEDSPSKLKEAQAAAATAAAALSSRSSKKSPRWKGGTGAVNWTPASSTPSSPRSRLMPIQPCESPSIPSCGSSWFTELPAGITAAATLSPRQQLGSLCSSQGTIAAAAAAGAASTAPGHAAAIPAAAKQQVLGPLSIPRLPLHKLPGFGGEHRSASPPAVSTAGTSWTAAVTAAATPCSTSGAWPSSRDQGSPGRLSLASNRGSLLPHGSAAVHLTAVSADSVAALPEQTATCTPGFKGHTSIRRRRGPSTAGDSSVLSTWF